MKTPEQLGREAGAKMKVAHRAGWRSMISGKRTDSGIVLKTGAGHARIWMRGTDESREETAVYGTCDSVNKRGWVGKDASGALRVMEWDDDANAATFGDAAQVAPPVDATRVRYAPADATDYGTTPTTAQGALDDLAANKGDLYADGSVAMTGAFNFNGQDANAVNWLNLDDATELTIATGAVTATQSMHRIDTESDTSSDDLDTINGGSEGRVLYIRADNTARTVVVKHNTGNILCFGAADITLDETYKFVHLIYDGVLSKWLAIGGSGTGTTSPLTTKGDLYTYDTANARLPVGTDGYVLGVNSSTATGLEWIPRGASGGKTRVVGTVLYDNTLGSNGVPNTADADPQGRTGIPSGYEWIEVLVDNLKSAATAAVNDGTRLFFNGDTTAANYRRQASAAANGAAVVTVGDDSFLDNVPASNASTLANNFASLRIYIPHYADTSQHKKAIATTIARWGASAQEVGHFGIFWENTAAITDVAIRTDNDPTDVFVAGARIQVIGYKAEAVGGAVYSAANVTTPTDAELDSAFGTPATVGAGFIGVVDDAGAGTNEYLCWSDGTNWFFATGTKAT